jgi:hypothetical protein
MTGVSVVQRVENGFIAALAMTAAVALYPEWWWMPLAAFLLFDLSALGYLRSPSAGAFFYNLVHNYTGPGLVAAAALLTAPSLSLLSTTFGLVACSWAFHVGADRMLGYGLKHAEGFTHTHLGRIGRGRR